MNYDSHVLRQLKLLEFFNVVFVRGVKAKKYKYIYIYIIIIIIKENTEDSQEFTHNLKVPMDKV